MSDKPQSQPEDEVPLPEERVEDLEPEGEDAVDLKGGKLAPGNTKWGDITLKR